MYPWNIGKLHTNTEYLLGELGRGSLVRDSEQPKCAKRSQENVKLNPLRIKPTPVLQCTFQYISAYLTILQVNSSSSLLFESSTFNYKFTNFKVMFSLVFGRSPQSCKSFTKKTYWTRNFDTQITLKPYSAYLATNPSTRKLLQIRKELSVKRKQIIC